MILMADLAYCWVPVPTLGLSTTMHNLCPPTPTPKCPPPRLVSIIYLFSGAYFAMGKPVRLCALTQLLPLWCKSALWHLYDTSGPAQRICVGPRVHLDCILWSLRDLNMEGVSSNLSPFVYFLYGPHPITLWP